MDHVPTPSCPPVPTGTRRPRGHGATARARGIRNLDRSPVRLRAKLSVSCSPTDCRSPRPSVDAVRLNGGLRGRIPVDGASRQPGIEALISLEPTVLEVPQAGSAGLQEHRGSTYMVRPALARGGFGWTRGTAADIYPAFNEIRNLGPDGIRRPLTSTVRRPRGPCRTPGFKGAGVPCMPSSKHPACNWLGESFPLLGYPPQLS